MSVYNSDNFAGRVSYAARVIQSGQRTSRAFDTCFEMYDGEAVVLGLLRRAESNPELRANLPRYLSPSRLEELRQQPAPKNLKAYSRKLIAERAAQ